MQSKKTAVVYFLLSVVFISIACLLDALVPLSSVTSKIEIWGRLIAGICASFAFMSAGVTLITIPDEWAEKHIPFYRRKGQPSKFVVGTFGVVAGIIGLALSIWTTLS